MLRVTIIGGGPAGAAAAISLVTAAPRGGLAVRIVESREFPRSKVCGEFISPAATELLEQLVGRSRLVDAGAQRVRELVLERGDRRVRWPLPSPAWALSRRALDDVLLLRARELGCEVRQPERVAGVEYGPDQVRIRLASGTTFESDLVIHADGSGRHDPSGPTPVRAGVVGLKCFFRPRDGVSGVTMRAARGAYLGTIGVESGLSTLALVARAELLKQHGADADRLVHAIWPAFDPATREGAWLSCGVGASGSIAPGHARSFRIGNAAAAVEPIGGEGIGMALWSGQTIGRSLAACAEGAINAETLFALQGRFGQALRSRLRIRRPACRLAAEVLMHPNVMLCVWPLLRAPSLTIRPWYGLTGKPLHGESSTACTGSA